MRKKPGVDDRRVDAERLDLGGERLHPAVDAELRRGVGGAVLEAGEARGRGDRHDVPGALLAHDRQDGAGDVHRADQARGDLPVHLLGRELLEEARVEAGGVVDEHVDAAEAVDSGLDRRLGVLRAGDVELDDEQVVRVADGLGDGVGVAAGGHDVVAGGERGLGDVEAHSAAGAGDEPGLLLGGHGVQQSADLEKVGVPVERATGSDSQARVAGSRLAFVETKTEIREFLTSRRGRITPEQAGLPTYGARRVPGLRREEVAVLAGVSIQYYTRLERGDMSGASEGVLEALARALQLDDAERAHLFDLARAAQPGRGAPAPAPAQATHPARDPVDARRDHRRRRLRRQRPPRHPRHQPARTRAVLRAIRRTRAAGQPRAVRLPRPARRNVLRRLGPRRPRDRSDPALGRRPRPLRPRPLRPRRRARHAERGVPHPLGRPQRPLPRHRGQALPPPRRRRTQPQLQPPRHRRRPRAHALHLRRRTRLPLRGGAEPTRELGGHSRRRESRVRPTKELRRTQPSRPERVR